MALVGSSMGSVFGSFEFAEWFDGLLDHDQDAVSVAVDWLQEKGEELTMAERRWTPWSEIKNRTMSPERQARTHEEAMAALRDTELQELQLSAITSEDLAELAGCTSHCGDSLALKGRVM